MSERHRSEMPFGGVLPVGPPTFGRRVAVDASGLMWQRDPRGCRGSDCGKLKSPLIDLASINNASTFTVEANLVSMVF
jgi:hypothetical protein